MSLRPDTTGLSLWLTELELDRIEGRVEYPLTALHTIASKKLLH